MNILNLNPMPTWYIISWLAKTLIFFTLVAYQDIAMDKLASTHPIMLGLTLNFYVFHYDIMNMPKKACAFTK